MYVHKNKTKVIFLLIIFFGIFGMAKSSLASCSGSGTTWNCTAGSSSAQIQQAVDDASDGATITFATGSYNIQSIDLYQRNGITLICTEQGECNMTASGDTFTISYIPSDITNLTRISGFNFTGSPNTGKIWFYGNKNITQFRIDHNTFSNFATGSIAIVMGSTDTLGKMWGVIDHNNFTGANNFMGVKLLWGGSDSLGGSGKWQTGLKGSQYNTFIEDNTWNFANNSDLGSGGVDAWMASGIVFRHNSMTNSRYVNHSYCHGGPVNAEIYDNTIVSPNSDPPNYRNIHFQGSGEIIAFNNIVGGVENTPGIEIQNFRGSQIPDEGYCGSSQWCDGTTVFDGNRFGEGGYPCWHQPGRDGSATLKPIYMWNNVTQSSGNQILPIDDDTTRVALNRDLFNAVSKNSQSSSTSPFDGSTGMGFGTLANRPTTCSTAGTDIADAGHGGVGYFATDVGSQGTLYNCNATNTWSVYYTPYTYPHPLVSETSDTTPPAAPSGFSVL